MYTKIFLISASGLSALFYYIGQYYYDNDNDNDNENGKDDLIEKELYLLLSDNYDYVVKENVQLNRKYIELKLIKNLN